MGFLYLNNSDSRQLRRYRIICTCAWVRVAAVCHGVTSQIIEQNGRERDADGDGERIVKQGRAPANGFVMLMHGLFSQFNNVTGLRAVFAQHTIRQFNVHCDKRISVWHSNHVEQAIFVYVVFVAECL